MPAVRTARKARKARSANAKPRKKPPPSDPCPKCGRIMSRASDLPRHMATHGRRRFACSVFNCHFTSHTIGGLRVHRNIHKGIKVPCPYCGKALGDASSVNRHMKRWHPQYKPAQRAKTIQIVGSVSAQRERQRYSTSAPVSNTMALINTQHAETRAALPRTTSRPAFLIHPLSHATKLPPLQQMLDENAARKAYNLRSKKGFQVEYARRDEVRRPLPYYEYEFRCTL